MFRKNITCIVYNICKSHEWFILKLINVRSIWFWENIYFSYFFSLNINRRLFNSIHLFFTTIMIHRKIKCKKYKSHSLWIWVSGWQIIVLRVRGVCYLVSSRVWGLNMKIWFSSLKWLLIMIGLYTITKWPSLTKG